MRLGDIYKRAVETGIEYDPRGKREVKRELKRVKDEYKALSKEEKEIFDREKFQNPYADTRILHGDPEREIRRVMVGVDMEVGEILLADRLREKGTPVDLVLAHHPEGRAMITFYEVMEMQAEILHRFGVPINVAEDLLRERIKEVERRIMPINYSRAVDVARMLDLPFMCVHTPSDNMVATYLQRIFDREEPLRIKDILGILMEIPEYREAAKEGSPPKVLIGDKDRKAGKVFVDMTGGTEGSKKAFERLSHAGVGTIVAMHLTEDHRKEAEKHHLNVVIAGHISSDNLGINLLLDRVLEQGMEIIPCSGFRRFTMEDRKRWTNIL